MESMFFLFLGVLLALVAITSVNRFRKKPFEEAASALIEKAERDIAARRASLLEAAEQEKRTLHFEIEKEKQNLAREKDRLEKKASLLDEQSLILKTKSKQTESTQKELERMARLTFDEARSEVIAKAQAAALCEAKQIRETALCNAKDAAEAEAHKLIFTALCRLDLSSPLATTTVSIALPKAEMRSKIIGRDGRNLAAFEKCTGTSLIIDDGGADVTISCFDPARRHIAQEALVALLSESKITPSRIEEIVENTEQQFSRHTIDIGRKAALDCGISDLDSPVLKVLGALQFRSSAGQNVLAHSIEVAHLAKMLAGELGFRADTACRIGLLHDIGKALPPDYGARPANDGYNFATEARIEKDIAVAIGAHHDEMHDGSPESAILKIADRLSAERPFARRDSAESHFLRLEELETIAKGHEGVAAAYAMNAGREVRVFVRPDSVDDDGIERLAETLAARIEGSKKFSGKIQVTVIREKKCVAYAE